MTNDKPISLEEYKASRMPPTRFHTVAEVDRTVVIDIRGTFSVAAARLYANAIIQRCDAIDFDNSQDPKAE